MCCGSTSSIDVRARGVRGVQTDFALRGATFGQMLMLVDGVRLNDAQSGHHNGDIPVPLELVERIEVLYGPGSSLFGADAVGGTVNIVTRRESSESATVEGGSFGLVAGQAQGGCRREAPSANRPGVSFDRSDGFMYDRDFKTAILRSRTSFGNRYGPVGVVPLEGVRRQQLLWRQCAVARVDEPDARRRGPQVWRGWRMEHRWSGVVPHARRPVPLQSAACRRCPTTGIGPTPCWCLPVAPGLWLAAAR